MSGDGVLADHQRGCDFAVALAPGHECQHFDLTTGQPHWSVPARSRRERLDPSNDRAPRRVAGRPSAPPRAPCVAVWGSPSCRHASPIRTRTRAASYGASSCRQASHARRSTPSAAWASPTAKTDGPGCVAGHGVQQRRAEVVGDLFQLISGRASRREIVGGQHDLDERGQHFGPDHSRSTSSSTRRITTTAASTRPWASRSNARPGCGSRPHSPACRYACAASANSPPKAVQLALLVKGHSGRRSGRRAARTPVSPPSPHPPTHREAA